MGKLSVFTGSLTLGVMVEQMIKLAKAFPDLDDNWFAILKERLKDRKFTDERLIRAVNSTIDNFKYGKPNIAEIMNYDEAIEMIRYADLQAKARIEGYLIINDYKAVNVNGEKFFTPKENVIIHKLKLWKPSTYMRRTS